MLTSFRDLIIIANICSDVKHSVASIGLLVFELAGTFLTDHVEVGIAQL